MTVPAGLRAGQAEPDILACTYRLNPAYEVVPAERLSGSRGMTPADVDSGQDFYGVLLPRQGSGLEPRSICADTALLVLTLQVPGPLPAYAVRRSAPAIAEAAQRLVLDGVLQVFHGGSFVCGPEAAPVFPAYSAAAASDHLSVAALKYAQELTWLDEHELALRIYCYGRQPLTPALSRETGPAPALQQRLGLDADGTVQRIIGQGWHYLAGPPGGRTAWWQWSRNPAGAGSRMTYKLYVSPSVGEIACVLESVACLLATSRGAAGFKVGAGLEGICRPDKIVVYFPHFEDLQQFGWALEERIRGCPAHGVPLSAEVSADKLLTWGIDPPAGWNGATDRRTSWRMWLAALLAEYLLLGAGRDPGGQELWQFALTRLRLSGIDTGTWIPAGTAWMEQ